MRPLQDDRSLEHSDVVANSAMNRQRSLAGVNSYTRDLHFDVLAFLRQRLAQRGRVDWLDLCCGTGRALIEAGRALEGHPISITGVDLVPMFDPVPAGLDTVRLVASPLSAWEPDRPYDLITCVHGLHYLGDKLDALSRAVAWLAEDGFFLAHLDPASLRLRDGDTERPAGPEVLRSLRRQGLTYDPRKHLLSASGRLTLSLPFRYLGADDTAGPNYTGQPAVASIYARA
jgi:SAM-dependent methyltransferase